MQQYVLSLSCGAVEYFITALGCEVGKTMAWNTMRGYKRMESVRNVAMVTERLTGD